MKQESATGTSTMTMRRRIGTMTATCLLAGTAAVAFAACEGGATADPSPEFSGDGGSVCDEPGSSFYSWCGNYTLPTIPNQTWGSGG